MQRSCAWPITNGMQQASRSRHVFFSIFLMLAVIFGLAAPPARAQSADATISGSVIDQQGGLAIANAHLTLNAGPTAVATSTTASDGAFMFSGIAPGVYNVTVTAPAYQLTRSTNIVVAAGQRSINTFALLRENASANLQIIGRTSTADGARVALQSSTTITRSISPQALAMTGFNRIGEALGTLPGVNLRGQNANTGDDLYVDIRGLKPSETQTLLDGHPIGPIGVNSSTTAGGYDYMASPISGLRNIQVTYGAGALGLYGTDSAGGTVDWQTLDPTTKPTASVSQSYGSLDHLSTSVVGSGTYRKMGVVLAYGVLGNSGLFDGAPQLQSGLLGTNLTSANYAKNTYPVSGDSILRSGMGKFRFDFGPSTQLTLTAFAVSGWEDKTGTGNNYTPYATQYYNTVPKGLATSGTCAGQVQVTTDTGKACLPAATYAALTSGPAGTGAGRSTSTGDQDFHGRLTSTLLGGSVTVDAFQNTYMYNNPTPLSQNTTVPTFQTDHYQTFGFLVSDDYSSAVNDIGLGWYVQHQRYNGIRNNYLNPLLPALTPVASIATGNIFLRDVYSPSHAVELFVNAWLKQSTSSEVKANSLDPRASLVLRPTSSDVIRFTGGKSVGLPDPTQAIGTGITNAGSLNPQCTNLQRGVGGINVGTPGVSGLQPETSTDIEVAYGHKFGQSTTLEGDYYNSSVKSMLFPTLLNASHLPPGTISPTILGNVNSGLFSRVYNYSAACKALLNPADPTSLIPYLAFTVPTNAANGLFRGIELTLRHRFSRRLTFDATWDVQSSVALNIPNAILKQNVYLINGSQLFGIPLQKQNAALDYSGRDGIAGHIDTTRFGIDNQFDAPPFFVTNAYVAKHIGRATITIGGTNIFGARDDTFAQTGVGLYVPENSFGTDTTGLSQSATYNKLRSYQPPQYVFSVSQTF